MLIHLVRPKMSVFGDDAEGFGCHGTVHKLVVVRVVQIRDSVAIEVGWHGRRRTRIGAVVDLISVGEDVSGVSVGDKIILHHNILQNDATHLVCNMSVRY